MKTVLFAAMLLLFSATAFAQQAAPTADIAIPCANAKVARKVYSALIDNQISAGGVPYEFFADKQNGTKHLTVKVADSFYKIEMEGYAKGQSPIVRQTKVSEPSRPTSTK